MKDLVRCSTVCQGFRRLTSDESLWKKLLKHDFPKVDLIDNQAFSHYQHQYGTTGNWMNGRCRLTTTSIMPLEYPTQVHLAGDMLVAECHPEGRHQAAFILAWSKDGVSPLLNVEMPILAHYDGVDIVKAKGEQIFLYTTFGAGAAIFIINNNEGTQINKFYSNRFFQLVEDKIIAQDSSIEIRQQTDGTLINALATPPAL